MKDFVPEIHIYSPDDSNSDRYIELAWPVIEAINDVAFASSARFFELNCISLMIAF